VSAARKRNAEKRGGGGVAIELNEALDAVPMRDDQMIALDDSMNALARFDPRKAKVVELRFFGGLTVQETAEVLKTSEQTVLRDWRLARTWLAREMESARQKRELIAYWPASDSKSSTPIIRAASPSRRSSVASGSFSRHASSRYAAS